MTRRYRLLVPILCWLSTACADLTSARPGISPPTAGKRATVFVDGEEYMYFASEQEARDTLPLPAVYVTRPELTVSGTDITAKASMEYFGNRGSINNTLFRISGSYSLANQSVSRLASHVFDTRRSLTTNVVNTEVPTSCGWSITLDGSYTARTVLFVEIHGITDLGGPDVKYDSRNHQQGACDPCQGPATARAPDAGQSAPRFDLQKDDRPVCGGGSPGGGSGLTCVEVFTDHYWYYPDTGQIEYRFTTVEQYCFNAT